MDTAEWLSTQTKTADRGLELGTKCCPLRGMWGLSLFFLHQLTCGPPLPSLAPVAFEFAAPLWPPTNTRTAFDSWAASISCPTNASLRPGVTTRPDTCLRWGGENHVREITPKLNPLKTVLSPVGGSSETLRQPAGGMSEAGTGSANLLHLAGFFCLLCTT